MQEDESKMLVPTTLVQGGQFSNVPLVVEREEPIVDILKEWNFSTQPLFLFGEPAGLSAHVFGPADISSQPRLGKYVVLVYIGIPWNAMQEIVFYQYFSDMLKVCSMIARVSQAQIVPEELAEAWESYMEEHHGVNNPGS